MYTIIYLTTSIRVMWSYLCMTAWLVRARIQACSGTRRSRPRSRTPRWRTCPWWSTRPGLKHEGSVTHGNVSRSISYRHSLTHPYTLSRPKWGRIQWDKYTWNFPRSWCSGRSDIGWHSDTRQYLLKNTHYTQITYKRIKHSQLTLKDHLSIREDY